MNEVEIRTKLQAKLAASKHGQGAAFVSELFIDDFARRADLVMANGKLAAFEIKSDRDSLDRLEGQLATYRKLFEQVTIVCALRHQSAVQQKAPDGVGVWVMDSDGQFKVIRRARTNRQNNHISWLSFLPVDELRQLLRQYALPRSGMREVLVSRASEIAIRDVRQYVLSYFKERRDIRISKKIARKSSVLSQNRPPVSNLVNIEFSSLPLRAIPRKIL